MIEIKNPSATVYFDRETYTVTKMDIHHKVVLPPNICREIAKIALKSLNEKNTATKKQK